MTQGELAGFVYRFEAKQGAERTLLLLHGTGGDENDLVALGEMLDPRAHLLSPRGPVLEGGAARFFRRFAEGVLDVDDLKARTHDLRKFVDAAATEHGFSPGGVVAVGYSNGANIAASVLFLHPDALAAAVLLRPMLPYEPDPTPDLRGVRVFIGSARDDPIVDPHDAERLAGLLASAGADVETSWTAGGHALQVDEVRRAAAWLAAG